MIFLSRSWKTWVLFVLAALVIGGYLGVLTPVQEQLEELAKTAPIVRAANQPTVAGAFRDPGGRADAYVILFLFVFLSPLALVMAVTLVIFLLSAMALALAPVMGGERNAMLVVAAVSAVAVYVERDLWLPHAMYFLGLLARAYVVITTT
jgi:hypothetical protein